MRRTLLPLLLLSGCASSVTTGLADPFGGVAIARAATVPGGEYVIVSSRFADDPARAERWWLVRIADRQTWLLTDERGPVSRWTDAEVWPSPDGCELAVVQQDEIRIFNVAEGRFTDRLTAAYEDTLGAATVAWPRPAGLVRQALAKVRESASMLPLGLGTLHGGNVVIDDAELAELFHPPSPLERPLRFWAEYRHQRTGAPAIPDLTPPPAPPTIAALDFAPWSHNGKLLDRYGDTTSLTNLTAADGRKIFDSHAAQWYRNFTWALGAPMDAVVANYERFVLGAIEAASLFVASAP